MNVFALHLAAPAEYPNACQIYRTNLPFTELGKHGWDVGWDYIDAVVEDYEKRGRQAWIDLGLRWDLVVLPRAVAPTAAHYDSISALIELFHRLGKPVVYEVDDDFTNDHRDLSELHILGALDIAKLCDAVTVTTPFLAETMQKKTKKPVYVLPNCLDTSLWTPVEGQRENPLIIGLSGSTTHEQDWRVLETVMPRILAEHDEVQFALAAFHPDYLKDLPNTLYLPGMDYVTYAEYVKRCDIVLCPVDPDDGFNMGKSPIKAVEGMAAGAAVIATDHPIYRLAIEDGKTGLLAKHTPEGWYDAITRLVMDHTLRRHLKAKGCHWVRHHHAISRRWTLWAQAYTTITSRYRPAFRSA